MLKYPIWRLRHKDHVRIFGSEFRAQETKLHEFLWNWRITNHRVASSETSHINMKASSWGSRRIFHILILTSERKVASYGKIFKRWDSNPPHWLKPTSSSLTLNWYDLTNKMLRKIFQLLKGKYVWTSTSYNTQLKRLELTHPLRFKSLVVLPQFTLTCVT